MIRGNRITRMAIQDRVLLLETTITVTAGTPIGMSVGEVRIIMDAIAPIRLTLGTADFHPEAMGETDLLWVVETVMKTPRPCRLSPAL